MGLCEWLRTKMTVKHHWGYREPSLATPEGLLQWSLPLGAPSPEQQPWLSRQAPPIRLVPRIEMAPGHHGFPSLICIRGAFKFLREKRTGWKHFEFDRNAYMPNDSK